MHNINIYISVFIVIMIAPPIFSCGLHTNWLWSNELLHSSSVSYDLHKRLFMHHCDSYSEVPAWRIAWPNHQHQYYLYHQCSLLLSVFTFPLPSFDQLTDSTHFHFSHQHAVKDERYNLAVWCQVNKKKHLVTSFSWTCCKFPSEIFFILASSC